MAEVEVQNDSDFESCSNESNISISEQVEDAIRDLEDIYDKVQAIAINHYMTQKRQLDK